MASGADYETLSDFLYPRDGLSLSAIFYATLTNNPANPIFRKMEDKMHLVTMHEAETNLSKLVKESLEGEEVVIARDNKPLVRLVPVQQVSVQRRLGGCPGLIVHMDDDFDAPLDDFADYM